MLLLCGPLGVGKTTLVRALLESEGCRVMSPAFTVCNSYVAGNKHIYHVDLYRLKNSEDLESTGFWDIFQKKNPKKGAREEVKWLFIEWADRLPFQQLPHNWNCIKIDLKFAKATNLRQINVSQKPPF